jgi:erythronate-4-phosphate dehydrogenase
MTIIADSKIPFVQEAFADLGDVVLLKTTEITPEAIRDADALLVRSETRVDETLLTGSRVAFVATATIGMDHVDTDFLSRTGIAFASAPGCNANSVGEYITSALLTLAKRLNIRLPDVTLGVVGVGNVGSIVVRYARALGMTVLKNDPPRERREPNGGFQSLDALMNADVITIHVPLTKSGPDKTHHLFDAERIGRMKSGSILINSSRGSVVETAAVTYALAASHLRACVLDVWEGEPEIDVDLLGRVALGSPHIAGYSFDGKVNGTVMIHQAFCRWRGARSSWSHPDASHFTPGGIIIPPSGGTLQDRLLATIKRCYDIEIDDAALRAMVTLPAEERRTFFRQLRAGYRKRLEFKHHRVVFEHADHELEGVLRSLGFESISMRD